jgi:hypothetical protein
VEGDGYLCVVCSALLFSQWVMKKPLIQRMLGKELTLPQGLVASEYSPGRSSLFSAVC